MPYLHISPDYAEEYGIDPEELPGAVNPDKTVAGKGFAYDTSMALGPGTFDPATLDFEGTNVSGLIAALRDAGYAAVRVQYDGGYDEGFAHFDAAVKPDGTADGAAAVRTVVDGQGDLDELAYALAVRLLEEGFGTGEYEMFGAFLADLSTGKLTDLKDAEPHEHSSVMHSSDG